MTENEAGEEAAAVQQDGPLVHGYLIFSNYRCTLDEKKSKDEDGGASRREIRRNDALLKDLYEGNKFPKDSRCRSALMLR